MDILSFLRGQSQPAPIDPASAKILRDNPNMTPSEVLGQLHGQRTSDINLPQSTLSKAADRLKTVLAGLNLG